MDQGQKPQTLIALADCLAFCCFRMVCQHVSVHAEAVPVRMLGWQGLRKQPLWLW